MAEALATQPHAHWLRRLEIEVGHVDRGAFIDWLSLFPGEKEMLFPPNSSLEVAGAVRHEQSHKGLVLIWPLR